MRAAIVLRLPLFSIRLFDTRHNFNRRLSFWRMGFFVRRGTIDDRGSLRNVAKRHLRSELHRQK